MLTFLFPFLYRHPHYSLTFLPVQKVAENGEKTVYIFHI